MVPVAALALAGVLTATSAANPPAFALQDARIGESSGLATSSYNGGLVLTHNDSGNAADYFVVDTRTGKTVQRVAVPGSTNVDWEDIAVSGHTVYLADIGDNRATRTSVTIYAVRETKPGSLSPAARASRLTYDDGPRDAEALLVPPGKPPRFVVTKQLFGAGVYEIAGSHLHRVADLQPGLITGGSWSPDGSRIALVSYLQINVYDAATFPAGVPQVVALPKLKQAESITWSGNDAVLVGSEGVHSPVYRVAVPLAGSAAKPSVTATATGTPRAAATTPTTTAQATPTTSPAPVGDAVPQPNVTQKTQAGLRRSTSVAAILVVLALVAVAAARIRRRRGGGLG